jgi:ribosomal protein L21E
MELWTPYILIFVVTTVVGLGVLISRKGRAFLEAYSGAVGVVFGLIAGAFVLVEYDDGQQDKRLARTLAYIERIESGPTHESRQWLDLHWLQNRALIADIKEANLREDGRDDALRLLATYRQSFDEMDDESRSNISHVMRLSYFYSDLAQCVELDLCDAPTACNIFADDIGEFYVLHADFIQRWGEVSFDRNFQTIKSFLNDTCGNG